MKNSIRHILLNLLPLALLLFAVDASAELASNGLLDDLSERFRTQAATWGGMFKSYASWLFWTLATISMVWTFGMLALRKADIGEFFAEFIRFAIFVGFFWWLLDNGPEFAEAIIGSLSAMGGEANQQGGFEKGFSPSGVVDIGFNVIGSAVKSFSPLNIGQSLLGALLALGVLLMTIMIAVNMLIVLVSAWVLAYAGIFFLGFGGSRWTHDIALNYYKSVLGLAAKMMTMLLIIGIGASFLEASYKKLNYFSITTELAAMFAITLVVYLLSNKIPEIVAGMISFNTGKGLGEFSAGQIINNTLAAATAVKTGGASAVMAATKMAGAGSAVSAAYKSALADMPSGGGKTNRSGGMVSPLMKAMGIVPGSMAPTAGRLLGATGNAIGRGLSNFAKSFEEKADNSAGGKLASDIKNKDKARQNPFRV